MASLQTVAASDLAAIMADSGGAAETITYTTSAGVAGSAAAIVFAEDVAHEYGAEGEYVVRRRQAVLQTATIADPSVFDSVTIAGEKWKIERIDGRGFGKVTLNLILDEPKAKQVEMLKKKLQ